MTVTAFVGLMPLLVELLIEFMKLLQILLAAL